MHSIMGIPPLVVMGVISGLVMIRAGVSVNLLALRKPTPCPACGRHRRGSVCSWCARQ